MEKESLHIEKGLLLRIAEDDEKAFEQLFDKFRLPVYAHVLSVIKSPEKAEEITQDVFLQIWNKRKELLSVKSFHDWLFITTRNRSLSELRKVLTTRAGVPCKDQITNEDPLSALLLKETGSLLQRAINHLPPRRKQIFIMSRIEQKSHKEIAAALGITPGTVNLQLVQALTTLRSFLYETEKNQKNFPGEYIYMLLAASLYI